MDASWAGCLRPHNSNADVYLIIRSGGAKSMVRVAGIMTAAVARTKSGVRASVETLI